MVVVLGQVGGFYIQFSGKAKGHLSRGTQVLQFYAI